MANDIRDNVIVVDSACGNTPLASGLAKRVQAFAFWAADTTGEVIFSVADTTQVIARLTASNSPASVSNLFLGGVNFNVLKCPTLTAGTAWIYLA